MSDWPEGINGWVQVFQDLLFTGRLTVFYMTLTEFLLMVFCPSLSPDGSPATASRKSPQPQINEAATNLHSLSFNRRIRRRSRDFGDGASVSIGQLWKLTLHNFGGLLRSERRLLQLKVGIEPSQLFSPECLTEGQHCVEIPFWALNFLLKRLRFSFYFTSSPGRT